MSTSDITCIGIVGAGAMGRGIAQVMAQAGLATRLFDLRPGAAQQAREQVESDLGNLVRKGKLSAEAIQRTLQNLQVVDSLAALRGCQLMVEAIVENLEAKQALFRQMEALATDDTLLVSNTSSLSITAIAAACRDPGRVAGLHFFNPVPRMCLVEVIDGLATRPEVGERLLALVTAIGHRPVRAKDTPGFIVNHAGRAFGTEALRVLGEGVASVQVIDTVLREGAGFRMGPFELLDQIGLDVSVPVMESVYRQWYEEPRFRPHPLLRQMLAAGHLGRKSGEGFYCYREEQPRSDAADTATPPCENLPPIWLGADDAQDRARLLALLERLGADVERGEQPSAEALCLLAPLGDDASSAAQRFAVDPARVVAVDVMADLERLRCLMLTPATDDATRDAAHALFSRDGARVALIRDSAGFVVQRCLGSIVNLACEIAQQRIAEPVDIDLAVHLGLGYPRGPLAWGDELGAGRLLHILERLHALSGDPRYRPSPWLRRRAQLGLSLCQAEPQLPV